MGTAHKVLASSFLLALIKVINRSLGLISTLILARILTPDDFGLVAIVALTIQLFEILGETGSDQYIIQKNKVSNADLNSAWTLNIIIKIGLWIIFLLAVPFICDFYEKPELREPLYAISLLLLIKPLINPGYILLKKELDYKYVFRLSVIQKLLSFIITIGIVLYHASFWALIIGDLVSALVFTVGSYFIHPHKPNFHIKKIKKQWGFSQWILFKSLLGFTSSRLDLIMITKFFETAIVGQFYVIKNIAVNIGLDIITPIIEPLLSAFSQVKNDPARLSYQVQLSLVMVLTLILPINIFIYYFPQSIIDFFLGSQWDNTAPLMSAASIMLTTLVIGWFLNNCIVALGKVQSLFYFDLACLIFIFTLLYTSSHQDVVVFTFIRSFLSLIVVLVFFYYVSLYVKLNLKKLAFLISPVLIALPLAVIVTKQIVTFTFTWPIINLLIEGSLFFCVYILTITLLGHLLLKKTEEYLFIKDLIMNGKKSLSRDPNK